MGLPSVDELLEAAAISKSNADYERLFARLKDVELFLNISSDEKLMTTPLADVGNGQRAIILYTSKDNAKLQRPYGGMLWQQALNMLVKIAAADGMVIEGANSYWVAINRARAEFLLQNMAL
jgi:hypothetical protein